MSRERYAVLGNPIEHSLSPAMHNAAFRAASLDACYERHQVIPQNLPAHVRSLVPTHRGFNVTIPHKESIVELIDQVDPAGRTLGAINTVTISNGRLQGTSTDPLGFRRALKRMVPDVTGMAAVVFGAGGSARAVVYALNELRVRVMLSARSSARAHAIQHIGPVCVLAQTDLLAALRRADLLVNCTPLGMAALSGKTPIPTGAEFAPGVIAMDLVYGRETEFIREVRRQGGRAEDGLEMLVQQGVESFRIWTGIEPDSAVMRAACLAVLEERACSAS